MAKKTLTPEEQETLRVMKMQEGDLEQLAKDNESQHEQLNKMGQRLEALKERARSLAQAEGVSMPEEHHYPTVVDKEPTKMELEVIPSWESLKERADNQDVKGHPAIEDFLTSEEINKAKEQVKSIEDEFAKLTGLSKRDLTLLHAAIGLQTARWMMIPNKPFNQKAANWLFGIVSTIAGKTAGETPKGIEDKSGKTALPSMVYEKAFKNLKQDWLQLPAAVFLQFQKERAILKKEASDPAQEPAMEFSPEMVGDLYKAQYQQLLSMQDFSIVGPQAALPLMTNMVIGLLHGYMYRPDVDGPREFYEARTRKILTLSNLIASSSNIVYTASTELWTRIDTGGLLIAASRAAQDGAYLLNLREAFEKMKMKQVLEKELQDIDSHFKHLPTKKD